MGKKLIVTVFTVVMILSGFVFAGCNSFNLADYKADGKTAIQTYANIKVQENDYTDAGLQVIAKAVTDGKDVVDAADTKEAVDSAVQAAKDVIDEVEKEGITVDGISSQFDLTEPKEYWTGSIDDDFENDRVVIIMKKTTIYPELELESFGLKNAESLHYSFLVPTDEKLNFHQILVIYLKTKGKDQVVLAINELNKLDFIKTASPEYIYGTQDD